MIIKYSQIIVYQSSFINIKVTNALIYIEYIHDGLINNTIFEIKLGLILLLNKGWSKHNEFLMTNINISTSQTLIQYEETQSIALHNSIALLSFCVRCPFILNKINMIYEYNLYENCKYSNIIKYDNYDEVNLHCLNSITLLSSEDNIIKV